MISQGIRPSFYVSSIAYRSRLRKNGLLHGRQCLAQGALVCQPPHFATDDPEALHQLMQAHPLGALITHGSQGLDANHLPFKFAKETGGQGVLRAHVALNN